MSNIWNQTIQMLSFADANVRYVFTGMVLLGIVGGILGSFTLLRKRALIGDALAHAALPGVGIAFLLTGQKEIWVLLIGAYIAGVLGVLSIISIRKFTKIKEDTALAIVLTVFFGIGIVILTYIQKTGMGGQSGLDKFLFGQSAAMVPNEVILIGFIAVILSIATLLFQKELTLLCFDSVYADSLGFPGAGLDILLMGMTVAVVVIGLQSVGVVLMAAMLIIPPVTARLWTHRILGMIFISAFVGAISGAFGTYLSFLAPKMPSGPLTVLAGTTIFLISLLIAPERGMITRFITWRKMVNQTLSGNILRAIAELQEIKGNDISQNLLLQDLIKLRTWDEREVVKKIKSLLSKKLAKKTNKEEYNLTESGQILSMRLLRRHRLWELFLMHQADIAADHVHRDADDNEHYLTPEIEEQLLKFAGEDKMNIPSPHPLSREGLDHA